MNSTTGFRKRSLMIAVVAAICATGMVATASAAGASAGANKSPDVQNPYSPMFGHGYRHGAVPTRETKTNMTEWFREHAHEYAASAAPTASTGILSYGGAISGVGVLSGQSKVYAVFYGSQWGTQTTDANGNMKFSNDSAGAAGAVQQMFKGIGTNGELWSAELTQWCDGSGVASGATSCPSTGVNFIPYQQNVFAGAYYDNTVASPSQATAAQLGEEANKAAAHFGNTTAASNRYAYYIILSPTGVNPDNYKSPTQGYCAWHDYSADAGSTTPYGQLAFSNQPYNIDVGASCGVGFVNSPGTLDGYTMTLGHEWHEMMSDQYPAGGWTNHTGGTYNGQENSDECAWIAAGSAGGAANITFATGTFSEQASWSNDTGNCAISHAILTHGGGTGGTPTANFSFTTSGLTANFTDSSTDSGGTIGTHSWTFGDGATSTSASPSHTYAAAGTYSVTETVTDSVNSTTSSKTSSVTVSGTSSNVLSNGVGVTISDSTVNHQQNWTVVIPAGATNLNISMSGGTGDPDLYVKFGSAPTTSSYDCRPYVAGPAESCPFASPSAGTYYVMVNTYAAYSGTTLKATWTAPGSGGTPTANFTFSTSGLTATFTDSSTDAGGTIGSHSWNFGDGITSTTTSPSHTYAAAGTYSVTETVTDSVNSATSSKTSSVTVSAASCGGLVLCSGVSVALPSESTGSWTSIYTMTVTAGHTATFAISGGTPDADLYVKAGSAPTLSSYNCRPYTSTSTESCTFTPSTTTTYYIGVEAYQSFSGVSLKGTTN
jgi:serine protease